jgi:hypothetical protein
VSAGRALAATGLIALAVVGGEARDAQRGTFGAAEVRQLVTFRWAERRPFNVRPSLATVLELYQRTPAVRRVRGFTEAESPEPFDLILMTSYRGLDGFELARREMAGQRGKDGRSFTIAYQELDQASQWHRDEFIEMLPHEHRGTAEARVFVLEWVRLVPASHRAYELLLQTAVVPWERDQTYVHLSETGRVIIGSGWDYLRILGFETLGGYHDYLTDWRDHAEADQLGLHVADRKTVIVREDETMRVR